MNMSEVIAELEEYRADFQEILSRFYKTNDGIYIHSEDDPVYRQKVLEVRDLLNDALGPNGYSRQIGEYYAQGLANFIGSPSYKSVEDIIGVLGAALTRLKRNPDLEKLSPDMKPDPRKVFVVHGRNEHLRRSLFTFLRAVGLDPIEWSEAVQLTGKGAPYIGEILEAAFDKAQAVVVLLTPDDEAKLREELLHSNDPDYERFPTGQARPNVIFEAGMAFARHAERTILIEVGELRPFSDVAGRHAVRLNNSPEKRMELLQRLKTAGCNIPTEGKSDWLKEGDFAVTPVKQDSLTQGNNEKSETSDIKEAFVHLIKHHDADVSFRYYEWHHKVKSNGDGTITIRAGIKGTPIPRHWWRYTFGVTPNSPDVTGLAKLNLSASDEDAGEQLSAVLFREAHGDKDVVIVFREPLVGEQNTTRLVVEHTWPNAWTDLIGDLEAESWLSFERKSDVVKFTIEVPSELRIESFQLASIGQVTINALRTQVLWVCENPPPGRYFWSLKCRRK